MDCTNSSGTGSVYPQYIQRAYFAGSISSGMFCLWVLLMFYEFPKYRRHPSELLIYRVLCDLLVTANQIWSFASSATRFQAHDDCTISNPGCLKHSGLGFSNQFAFLAADIWYLLVSVDLFIAIRNPFTFHNEYVGRFHALGWGVPLLSGVVLLAAGQTGLSTNEICWVHENSNDGFNIFSLILFYAPSLIVFIFSIHVLIVAARAFGDGMPETVETRRRVLKHSQNYVRVIGVYLMLQLLLWLLHVVYLSNSDKNRSMPLTAISVTLRCLRGPLDALAWFLNNPLPPREVWNAMLRVPRLVLSLCCRRHRHRRALAQAAAFANSNHKHAGLGERLLSDDDPRDDDTETVVSSAGEAHFRPRALSVTEVEEINENRDENINRALRRDIMLCTTWGICDAIDNIAGGPTRGVALYADSAATASAFQPSLVGKSSLPSEPTSVHRQIYLPLSLSSNTAFDFIDYSAATFASVRALCDIQKDIYRLSFVIPSEDSQASMLEKFTEGASGSFFYFTHDRKYMVKTVTPAERALLQDILLAYHDHVAANPASLLTRFVGLHAIRMSPEQHFITFVVMTNIFTDGARLDEVSAARVTPWFDTALVGGLTRQCLAQVYDLKGSWVGRQVIKDGSSVLDYKGTLKDLDLTRNIAINAECRAALTSQIGCDALFLNSQHIMDYSLLLGIHNCNDAACSDCHKQKAHKQLMLHQARDKPLLLVQHLIHGGIRGPGRAPGEESVLYCGIIDMLQLYNVGKVAEHFVKTWVLRKDGHGISAVAPDEYMDRFLDKLNGKFQTAAS